MWLVWPPARWWVTTAELPRVAVDAPPQTRFALYPDVQPMTFAGRGSGLDPDAYVRPNGVSPLDGSTAAYPAAVALRSFARTNSTAQLAALGVSRIIVRPWLQTDVKTLAQQLALPTSLPVPALGATRTLDAAPELALVSRLDVVDSPPQIGSNAVFYGDVAGMRGASVPQAWATFVAPLTIRPSGREIRAARAWVDVRQAFIAQPDVAQGLGGVITTSPSASLAVSAPTRALVWVRGELVDVENRTLGSGNGDGYRWIDVPAGSTALRCRGECVVAAFGTPPSLLQNGLGSAALTKVPFHAAVPWLAIAELPAGRDAGFLRYEIGYDSHWLALWQGGALPHLRVESAFNGWLVPVHALPERIVLIEYVAAIQQLCECIGLIWTIALAIRFVRERMSARRTQVA